MSGSRTTSAAEEVSGLGLGSQEMVRFLDLREAPERWWEILCGDLFHEGPLVPVPRQLAHRTPEAALLPLTGQETGDHQGSKNVGSLAKELKFMAPTFSQLSPICPLFY